ncbi:capsid protein [Hudisavirus sp.]|nr:capsid protein [Hudisavirus sp.]
MPTYVYRYPRRRYGRRYSRYRRSYYRYRRRRSGTSSNATNRGRIRVRVPIQQVLAVPVASGSTDSSIVTSSPFVSGAANRAPLAVCGAVGTPLYRAYANLYDQVKCDGVVTRLAILTPIGAGTNVSPASVQVVMAYDRMGCQREVFNNPLAPQQPATTASLFDYSSATVVSAINNSVAKTSRSCWSSDLQERTSFHDSSLTTTQANADYCDADWVSNTDRVGYFAPMTVFGMRLPGAPSADFVIQVMLEQTYYFTFRNPKYGGSANAGLQSVRHIPATMRARSDTRSLASEQDAMDDAGGLDDEDAAAAPPRAQRQATQVLQHDGEDPEEYLSPALQ